MSASDSAIPGSAIDWSSITVSDAGANSITLSLMPGATFKWTVEGTPFTEVKHQNKHVTGTPVARVTGDGNETGQLQLYCAGFYGSTAATPYEVFTNTGLAASWANTITGDKKARQIVAVGTVPSGASQTHTFRYVIFSNVAVDYQDGIWIVTADWINLQNAHGVT